MIGDYGLAMDLDDLKFLQTYFRDEEKRDPTITELRLVDTYWSDHCRHTTFGTHIDSVDIQDPDVRKAYERLSGRPCGGLRRGEGRQAAPDPDGHGHAGGKGAEKARRTARTWTRARRSTPAPSTFTVHGGRRGAGLAADVQERDPQPSHRDRALRRRGHLHRRLPSATRCPAGPMSIRPCASPAAAIPAPPWTRRCPASCPSASSATTAAAGYSSYGNQIGLATGLVSEIYHPGYVAKHLEVGAVVGAAPAAQRGAGGARPRRCGHPAGRPHRPRRHRRRHRLLQEP